MKKTILLGIILCSFQQLCAQFKVIDKNTNEGVSFAMIKVLHQEKGTTSSFKGDFNLDSFLNNKDSVKISCIGYVDFLTTVNNIRENKIIKLQTKAINLSEIIVTDYKTKFVTKEMQLNKNKRIPLDFNEIENQTSSFFIKKEIAIWVPNNYSVKGHLKAMSIYIQHKGREGEYLRIHIYDCNKIDFKPGKELTQSNLILKTSKNKWNTVNLEKQNINVSNNGFFIGIEKCTDLEGDYYDTNVLLGNSLEKLSDVKDKIWIKKEDEQWYNTWSFLDKGEDAVYKHQFTGKPYLFRNGDTVLVKNMAERVPLIKAKITYDKKLIKNKYFEPKKKEYISAAKTTTLNLSKYPQTSINDLLFSCIKAIRNNDILYTNQHFILYDSKSYLLEVKNEMKENLEIHGVLLTEENKKHALDYFQYVIDHINEVNLIEQEDGQSYILKIDNRTYKFACIHGHWKIFATYYSSKNTSTKPIQYQLKKN